MRHRPVLGPLRQIGGKIIKSCVVFFTAFVNLGRFRQFELIDYYLKGFTLNPNSSFVEKGFIVGIDELNPVDQSDSTS
jgi:hypothetical protein